jgi:hypothetical protein
MSRTLKWILGIVGVLIILAIIAGAFWAWQNRALLTASNGPYAVQPRAQNQQPFPYGQRGFDNGGRNPMFGWGMGPMMRGRGRFGGFGGYGMGFFFLGGLFRLVLPLLVLVAVAVLFYQLGKRSTTRVVRQETTAPNPPPANPDPPATD